MYSESDSSGYSKGSASDNEITSSDSFTVAETNNGKALLVGSGGGTAGWVDLSSIQHFATGGRITDIEQGEGLAYVGVGEEVLNKPAVERFDELYNYIKNSGGLVSQLSSQYSNLGNYTMPSLGADLNNLTNGITNNNSNTDNSNTQSISMPVTIINEKGAEQFTEQKLEKAVNKIFQKQATRYGGKTR